MIFDATISPERVPVLNVRTLPAIRVPQKALAATFYPHDLQLWHCRFGHCNIPAVDCAIKQSVVGAQLDNPKSPNPSICVPCVAGKQHRDPFPLSEHHATRPMEIIYCDLHGPFPVRTRNHKIYWAVFTCLYSRVRHLALLSTKLSSELLSEYKAFEARGKALFGEKGKVLTFRCDGGGEFLGELKWYLISQGTQYQQTTRDTPQQNGISERANRDIGEGMVPALVQSGLPDSFWGDAAQAFVHVTNRFPTAPLGDKTPYEMWHGTKPDVSHLCVWGCKAYVFVQRDQRTKTQSHTCECAFIGYPEDHKAWMFYDPKAKQIIISRDVVWDETSFLYPPKVGTPPAIGAQLPTQPATLTIPPALAPFLDPDADDGPGNAPLHAPPPAPAPVPVPLPPVPPVTLPCAYSPPAPPAPRCGQRQRFYPKEFWRVDAPLVPHRPQTPPSPTPIPASSHEPTPLAESPPHLSSPDPIAIDSDESEDPIAMQSINDLEHGLLTMAGIR